MIGVSILSFKPDSVRILLAILLKHLSFMINLFELGSYKSTDILGTYSIILAKKISFKITCDVISKFKCLPPDFCQHRFF